MAPWWLPAHSDEAAFEPDETEEETQYSAAEAVAPAKRPESPGGPLSTEPTEETPSESRRRKRRSKRRKRKSASESAKTRPAEAPPAETPVPEEPEAKPPQPAAPRTPQPAAFESAPQGIFYALPGSAANDERKIAMLVDLENIALGVRDSEIKKLDVNLILARLLEKGKIIVKKAYADWERYSNFKRPFHEAAIELIDIPQKYYSGKNSADIKMVVDAMDLCYSKEHLDTFALISGDSDFSPLASKLKENNKYVIGIGVNNSSSALLIDNCDEFIFYEDVWRAAHRGPRLDHLSPKEAEVFGLMSDAMVALIRENKDVLWGSMIKQTMQRKRPSFNESTYGYGSFSEVLEEAERKGVIGLKRDERSGSYVVTGFAKQ